LGDATVGVDGEAHGSRVSLKLGPLSARCALHS
jgi:hypothetical protein